MLVSKQICPKTVQCSLDRCLIIYSFFHLLTRKRKATPRTVWWGGVRDLTYLIDIFGYLDVVKLSVWGALSQPYGCRWKSQVHLAKLPWESSGECFRMCFCKLNFRVTVSCKFICWQKYADNWKHGRIVFKANFALDDLKI